MAHLEDQRGGCQDLMIELVRLDICHKPGIVCFGLMRIPMISNAKVDMMTIRKLNNFSIDNDDLNDDDSALLYSEM